ncbi:unnamed protein product [Symbiodinium natans]|uniref:Uncharacterized protein n=1 Tax=Symbiodinium natans TaxID=878477 RepID=A0A812PZK5_9DINO|nr:unnamed protein product [Symbiodinium natans]
MIAVLDGFVDDELSHVIRSKLVPLAPGARTALSEVPVPRQLEQRLQAVFRCCSEGRDPNSMALAKPGGVAGATADADMVLMPGRVAVGSSPMHQDTGFDKTGKPDPAHVQGFVAVLYLAGTGTLTIHSISKEHVVDVKPGRLVVWPNDRCIHRLDGGGSRMMLGPMALDSAGWKRAGDQYAVWRGQPCYGGNSCGCDDCKRRRGEKSKENAEQDRTAVVVESGSQAGTEGCWLSCTVS